MSRRLRPPAQSPPFLISDFHFVFISSWGKKKESKIKQENKRKRERKMLS